MSTFELDTYVVDALLPDLVAHDRAPSALLVYLVLWRRSRGAGQSTVQLSLIDIATATGLSKRAVQIAIGRMVKRRLLGVQRESSTAVPVYTVRRPWAR
ncbi:MAG: helix-turn-helix domain-containing protein [Gemmatimonadaceae bacterium]